MIAHPSPRLRQTDNTRRRGGPGLARLMGAALSLAFIAGLPVMARAETAAPAAAGSAEAGEKVFLKCRACHQIGAGAKHLVGPELNGVIGRKAGTVAGYSFSDAMKNSGLTWDAATLRDYLKNPRAKVTGTRMIFVGLPKDKDIDDLLAYVGQFDADGKKKP
ncbi:cytochrome c-550 [Camelimonas fluminis]|uniref:C-type cytochrome n=1 Tax=Camelimonas fluminis TaxID=1576911 RepID=A0ABV7UIT4_9HYPH|nr:cytochrome c-550 [Camelimonas fluminis]